MATGGYPRTNILSLMATGSSPKTHLQPQTGPRSQLPEREELAWHVWGAEIGLGSLQHSEQRGTRANQIYLGFRLSGHCSVWLSNSHFVMSGATERLSSRYYDGGINKRGRVGNLEVLVVVWIRIQ